MTLPTFDRVYHTMKLEKNTWGTGAWLDEPDKVEWKDEHTGLPCLIVRNRMGALCGYAGVTSEHPWFHIGYAESVAGVCLHAKHTDSKYVPYCSECKCPEDLLEVHGGLTYTGECQKGPVEEVVCHTPLDGEEDDVWWFGFDCSHAGDISPEMEATFARLQREDDAFPRVPSFGTYRTLEYVVNEVRSLAAQLAAYARR